MAKHSRSRSASPIWQTLACMLAMRIRLPSPSGVNGLRMLLLEIEQLTPFSTSTLASATPRRTLWSWSRPIMYRSVAGNTVTATPASAISAASRRRSGRRQGRILAAMADGDAAAQAVLLGQFADQMDVHVRRAVAGVEMHVDVGVVFAGQVENAVDLAAFVGVVVGGRADHPGAPLQRLDQQFVGAAGCWSGLPAGTRTARCRSPRRSRGGAVPARRSCASPRRRRVRHGSACGWCRA